MASQSTTERAHRARETSTRQGPSTGERLMAALAYLGPGFLVPILAGRNEAYVRWHTAQGFTLFFLEAIALGLAIVVDATIGQIPWVGLLVMLVLRVGLVAGFLVVSAVAFVKALAGERTELPLVARYAKHVPGAVGD